MLKWIRLRLLYQNVQECCMIKVNVKTLGVYYIIRVLLYSTMMITRHILINTSCDLKHTLLEGFTLFK